MDAPWTGDAGQELYLVRELREVVDGRGGETLLCPAGRDVGHGCEIVDPVEYCGFLSFCSIVV